jgi:hypothetical protein
LCKGGGRDWHGEFWGKQEIIDFVVDIKVLELLLWGEMLILRINDIRTV